MTVRKLKAVPRRLEALVAQDRDLLKALVQEALARTLTSLDGRAFTSQGFLRTDVRWAAARLLVYRAACNARKLANNVMLPEMKEASMAKAFVGHEAFHVVSESLQMFGAAGYSSALPLERMLRDVRMFQIGGGTSQAGQAIGQALARVRDEIENALKFTSRVLAGPERVTLDAASWPWLASRSTTVPSIAGLPAFSLGSSAHGSHNPHQPGPRHLFPR